MSGFEQQSQASPTQVVQQHATAKQWAGVDPITLCKQVRTQAYQNPQIAQNPQLIQPLDELISRFEQTLRAPQGVGATSMQQYGGQQQFQPS